ncbi:S-layer homology domain-containing protein [Paenibacillus sp. strain BS8-2]
MNRMFMHGTIALLSGLILVAPLQSGLVAAAAEARSFDHYFPIDIEDHWAYSELDNFVVSDLLMGYETPNGDIEIRPDQQVTRAEFVSLLVRTLGLKSEQSEHTFDDVPADKWYAEAVNIASSLGIVNGVSATAFMPEQWIERGEIAAMVVRAFDDSIPFVEEPGANSFTDVPADDYFASVDIAKASDAGIVNGMTASEFMPFAQAKRAEAVVMLQRALHLQVGEIPDETSLMSVITEADQVEMEAINNGELQGLISVLSKQYTAFQLSSLEQYVDGMVSLVDEGISISVEQTGERKLEVLLATDRYAILKSTGGEWQFKYKFDDQQQSETVSSDGHYYMKKTDDGNWKIYAIYEE